MLGLDVYSIPARLTPALLVALPSGLAVGVWFPQDLLGWSIGGGITVGCVLFILMAERARRLGRAAQDRMYEHLGGKPTTILLRHRDKTLELPTRQRYHRCLQEIVPNCALPTPKEEVADPAAADEQYESCTRFLLEETRDRKRFPLVFRELVSYGFVRNLRGMRPFAIGSAFVGVVACGVRTLLDAPESAHRTAAVGAILSAILLATWLVRLNDRWMRNAAFDYARALLASCDRIISDRNT